MSQKLKSKEFQNFQYTFFFYAAGILNIYYSGFTAIFQILLKSLFVLLFLTLAVILKSSHVSKSWGFAKK